MSTAPINLTLYRVLVRAGATEPEAAEAARQDTSDLVTKADLQAAMAGLKADLADLKSDLLRTQITAMIALTAIYGGLITFLKLFRP